MDKREGILKVESAVISRKEFLLLSITSVLGLALNRVAPKAPTSATNTNDCESPISFIHPTELKTNAIQNELHRKTYLKLARIGWRSEDSKMGTSSSFTSGVIVDVKNALIQTCGGDGDLADIYIGDLYNGPLSTKEAAPNLPNLRFVAEPIGLAGLTLRFLQIKETSEGVPVSKPLTFPWGFDNFNLATLTTDVKATKLLIMGFDPKGIAQHKYIEIDRALGAMDKVVMGSHDLPVGAGVFNANDGGLLGQITSKGTDFVEILRLVKD